jgi:hypothetical protein
MPLKPADNDNNSITNGNHSGSQNNQRKRTDSTSSILKSEKGSNANIQNHPRSKSINSVVRKTSSSNSMNAKNQTQNRPEELPLSFASFYYSLKVIKGKGMMKFISFIILNSLFMNFFR